MYFCPVGVTSGPTNKIFDVDINAGETVLLSTGLDHILSS